MPPTVREMYQLLNTHTNQKDHRFKRYKITVKEYFDNIALCSD